MERTYKIVGKTNPWIAQRDGFFKGRTTVVISSNLTLKQAREKLLEYFCEDYDVYFPNWGVAMNSNIGRNYACRLSDGTYSYEYDSRKYFIEIEEEE